MARTARTGNLSVSPGLRLKWTSPYLPILFMGRSVQMKHSSPYVVPSPDTGTMTPGFEMVRSSAPGAGVADALAMARAALPSPPRSGETRVEGAADALVDAATAGAGSCGGVAADAEAGAEAETEAEVEAAIDEASALASSGSCAAAAAASASPGTGVDDAESDEDSLRFIDVACVQAF